MRCAIEREVPMLKVISTKSSLYSSFQFYEMSMAMKPMPLEREAAAKERRSPEAAKGNHKDLYAVSLKNWDFLIQL